MGLTEACSRLLGELVQSFGGGGRHSNSSSRSSSEDQTTCNSMQAAAPYNEKDPMVEALIRVFGMEAASGRIKKDKARKVVEKLGLIITKSGGDDGEEELEEEVVAVEEVMGEIEKRRKQLLRQAFNIFDEDGNGFIEALELKRVLECLGLMDHGSTWDLDQIHKMLRVVDLNFDGKVDFDEFELMMGTVNPSSSQ